MAANPEEDKVRKKLLEAEKLRTNNALSEIKRINEEIARLKQRNIQLMVESTKAGDHIGTLNAKIHELVTLNSEKDKEISIFLNTTAPSAIQPGKRPREERSISEGRTRRSGPLSGTNGTLSFENMEILIHRALGPMQLQIESIMAQLNRGNDQNQDFPRLGRQPVRNNFSGAQLQNQQQTRQQLASRVQAQSRQRQSQRQQSPNRLLNINRLPKW